jgi:hypothetical protein
MNSKTLQNKCILSLAPCVQGIGYIVFDGSRQPVDWGVKWARTEKNKIGMTHVAALIKKYQPDKLVFEDHRAEGSRRATRIADLLDTIAALAQQQQIETTRLSRARIRQHFRADDAATKFQIAKTIAAKLPELAPRLPLERKIWLPEHANMSIFDAAALALTYFAETAQEGCIDALRAV